MEINWNILLYLNIPIGLIYAYWGMELVNQFSLEIENCSAVNINEIIIVLAYNNVSVIW